MRSVEAGFMTVQRRRGRPSDYCAEIAMTICDRLADGESLRAICVDAGMPDKATVFRWIGRHKAFRNQYALAREAQADDICDQILEIAHDSSHDYVKKIGADGKVTWVVDHEHDVHQQSHVTLHELLCQPPCDPTDNDSCDPSHSSVHG